MDLKLRLKQKRVMYENEKVGDMRINMSNLFHSLILD